MCIHLHYKQGCHPSLRPILRGHPILEYKPLHPALYRVILFYRGCMATRIIRMNIFFLPIQLLRLLSMKLLSFQRLPLLICRYVVLCMDPASFSGPFLASANPAAWLAAILPYPVSHACGACVKKQSAVFKLCYNLKLESS